MGNKLTMRCILLLIINKTHIHFTKDTSKVSFIAKLFSVTVNLPLGLVGVPAPPKLELPRYPVHRH